jgi:hypothetical protein
MRKPPHCASAYHFAHCNCKHERQSHEGQDQDGVCKERGCDCNRFMLAAGYPILEHMVPKYER